MTSGSILTPQQRMPAWAEHILIIRASTLPSGLQLAAATDPWLPTLVQQLKMDERYVMDMGDFTIKALDPNGDVVDVLSIFPNVFDAANLNFFLEVVF